MYDVVYDPELATLVCDTSAPLELGVLRYNDQVDLGPNHDQTLPGQSYKSVTLVVGQEPTVIGSVATGTESTTITAADAAVLAEFDPIAATQNIIKNAPGSGWTSDWAAFLEAPAGVCSAGIRELSLAPKVLQSSNFRDSVIPSGTSVSAQIPGGGYTVSGESFVGWA
jgi:hypothetical protein